MKITRRDIQKYRKMARQEWHDAEWHEYMNTKKADAIWYAETEKNYGDDYNDIAQKAMKYLADVKEYEVLPD